MSLASLRKELSFPRTSVQLCLLGIVGGIAAALVIVAFKLSYFAIQTWLLGELAAYQNQAWWLLLAMPLGAVSIILMVAKLTRLQHYRMGIPFVIHRIKMCYGHIPFKTSINQFFGGVMALAGGFVVGKEGPTVHLAAAASHHIGQFLKLPFNSLRILTGCGIAAGVAAAFNTPFAAVIFVMEVVLREYKLHIFVPVMLSAAIGTVITRAVFGEEYALAFLEFQSVEPFVLMYLIAFGALIGFVAAQFTKQLLLILNTFKNVRMSVRFALAASITAAVGIQFPDALGAEFVTLQCLLDQDASFHYLLLLFVLKYCLALVALGLGVPGGIVGAVMTIGMFAGVVLLYPLHWLAGYDHMQASFALLGLAGMLAAVLHAPMSALSAVMELAASSELVMPGIIVIVSAYVTSKQFCGSKSVFVRQLQFQGLAFTTSSIRDSLQQTGVLAIMKTDFHIQQDAPDQALYEHFQASPETALILKTSNEDQAVDYLYAQMPVVAEQGQQNIQRDLMQGLIAQSTLAEVYEILSPHRRGAVYVIDDARQVIGIITWPMLHAYLFTANY